MTEVEISTIDVFAKAVIDEDGDKDTLLQLILQINHMEMESLTDDGLGTLLTTMQDVGMLSEAKCERCKQAYRKRKASNLAAASHLF